MPFARESKSELQTAAFVLTKRQVARLKELKELATTDAVRPSLSDVARRVVEAGLSAYPHGLEIHIRDEATQEAVAA